LPESALAVASYEIERVSNYHLPELLFCQPPSCFSRVGSPERISVFTLASICLLDHMSTCAAVNLYMAISAFASPLAASRINLGQLGQVSTVTVRRLAELLALLRADLRLLVSYRFREGRLSRPAGPGCRPLQASETLFYMH
jgi:hypothetical protein